MADIICESIASYYESGKVNPTREQQKQLDSFVKDPNLSTIVIQRDDESPNGLSFAFKREEKHVNDTLVFVKCQNSGAQKRETIVNESQIISQLRSRLAASAGTHCGVLNILSDMRKCTKLPGLMKTMAGDREELLHKVLDWSEDCVVVESKGKADLVDRIGVLKAREGKLRAVIKVCESLFNDLEDYPSAKKTMEQLVREVSDESHRLFREWSAKCDDVRLDKRKQCIEIDTTTQVPRVTFDPHLVKLSQDCRILRCLAFNIPSEIADRETDVKRYGSIARELREIVNFYCTVGDHILLSQRPMLIDAAQAFTSLLESRDRISWDKEPLRLRAWLDELKEFAKGFSSENRLLRKRHNQVLNLILPLFDLQPSKWRSSINEVHTIIHDTDTRYSHTLPWKKHWDHQIYKVLEYHFNDALIRSDQWLGFGSGHFASGVTSTDVYRVDLCFVSGRVTFRPTLEEIKAKIYIRIKKFLMMPVQFQGFVEANKGAAEGKRESLFTCIYLRSFLSFPLLYSKAAEIVKEMQEVSSRFIEWTSLYYVIQRHGNSASSLASFLGLETIEDYKSNLMLFKTKAQKFNKEFIDNEITCRTANIVVNLVPIKSFIDWLLIEVDKLLIRTLKEQTEAQAKELSDECSQILEKLSNRPQSIKDLMELEDLLQNELNKVFASMNAKYQEIEGKANFLQKWSAKTAPNISNLSNQFEEFQSSFETRESLFQSFREMLKSRTEANIGNLKDEVETFSYRWNKTSQSMKETKDFISEIRAEVDTLAIEFEEVAQSCEYFGLNKPGAFQVFQAVVAEVREIDAKLNLINEFEAGISNYYEMEWIVSRNKLNTIENYVNKWEEENPNCGAILMGRIKEWRELLTVLKLCRGECFAKTHWTEFLVLLDLNKEATYESLKLSHLLSRKQRLIVSKDALRELNTRAVGETSVRDTFNELDAFAATASLALFDYVTSQGEQLSLIKDWRLILNQIAESILTLQSLKNSEYFSNEFAERGVSWEARLTALDTLINLLNSVQRKWTYLEPIYAKNQGPGVFTDFTFSNASREFVETMKTIGQDAHVVRLLRIPNLDTRLKEMDTVLVTCQKKLSIFMEDSRNRFPRFYFLADDDLLLVLAGKVEISQAGLLKKLFNNNIVRLHLHETNIVAIESSEGEAVKLKRSVSTQTDQVEKWLHSLELEIKSTLQKTLFEALEGSNSAGALQSISWDLPSQVLSLIQWIQFTRKAEEAIKRSKLPELKMDFGKQLTSLTSQQLESDDIVMKIKVKSLVLDTIHFLAVVEQLVDADVRAIEDWKWQKQMRYYINDREKALTIAMGTAAFGYSFEYLGCLGSAKLVHTPLTDKCYLTCLQAMSMGLGGNPYGPAGTGKTESVKALGQQLGRQVLVFNCDEAIDVKAMTRILVGLVKCGAWGCFDEFNRLNLDVLSALSSQVQVIQSSLKAKAKHVSLPEFGDVEIDQNSAVFITLNPAGKQYKGRNRLPDNLKALFLPVAMTVPDNVIISRVILLGEGFDINLSGELGEKITSWFELAMNCMTNQKHYDWGLRAIKTCLNASGRSLRTSSNKDQIYVVVESLRRQIKSKLIEDDEVRFEALIRDVFGSNVGLDAGETSADSLKDAVIKRFDDMNLVVDETQVTKILELDEQLKSRLGVVILGESGVGKSTIWKVLADARKAQSNVSTHPIIINPKSLTRSQLLGYIDEDTREWHDGVLPCKSRDVARDESGQLFWLVFDGDIDPEWVEALNSVLDDNQVLTLPSGERIDFDSSKVNLIFEVTSLKFASPATISRLGVISVGCIKSSHVIKSRLKLMKANISAEELIRNMPVAEPGLKLSAAKTLLSHIQYSLSHGQDVATALARVQKKTSSRSTHPFKTGNLVVTPSIGQVIEFMSPWVESDEAILLVGNKGVGKHTALSETILKTGLNIPIYCCPETMPSEIIKKLAAVCSVISSGCSKIMKSSSGGKLIVYLRHLELLAADKWQSKAVIAFLSTLITYNGFYDETSFEWTQLQNFQVIATCSNVDCLDSRLLSLMHVINASLPPLEEVQKVLELLCPESVAWKSLFASSLVKVAKELQRHCDQTDIMRCGVEIIAQLNRYEEVDNDILYLETTRALAKYVHQSPNLLNGMLLSCFGSFDPDKILHGTSFGSKLVSQNKEQYSNYIRKATSLWINETESIVPSIGLIQESLDIFAEVSVFLSNADKGVKGLTLVANSGAGRKLAVRVLSHVFGYDLIWIPKVKVTEKQLAAELKAITEQTEGEEERKVVLLLDELHFRLIPFLRHHVYTFMQEYNGSTVVRTVLTLRHLDHVNNLMWDRVCHIHYLAPLSEESLVRLPQMAGEGIKNAEFAKNFSALYRLFPNFARDGRRYLAFIHCFSKIFNDKKTDIEDRRSHLQVGVTKLDEASKEVETLKGEAAKQRQILADKRREADDALGLITSSMQDSEGQKVELEDIKGRTEKETAKLKIRKREIDEELKLIEPTLQAAKSAVGGIKSEALSEIRSLRAPPEVIRDILEGVLRLMGVNDTSWVSMKSFLSRRGVKDDIINFEARKIGPEMREKVEVLLQNRPDSFDEKLAKRASTAAAPLANWVIANVSYSKVLHKIKPLEDEQNRLESGLRSAQTRMKSLSNQLEGVETHVGVLRDRLNQVTVEAAQIEVGLKQTSQILSQSEALIRDLSGEFSRWKQQLNEINETIKTLPVRSLVAAAFVTFMGIEASSERRKELVKSCCQVVKEDTFDVVEFLDVNSEEEAFLWIDSPFLTPLVIDPGRRVMSHFDKAEITDMNSRDWLRVLELSLRFGRVILIDDFSRLDLALIPVLKHEVFGSEGSRHWTFIGDKRVDFNPNFKLFFLATSVEDDIFNSWLLNVINLAPSSSSTAATLLSLTIKVRRAELEEKRAELERNKQGLEARLRSLERELLSKLSSASGNLLNDHQLIESLKQIKKSSKEVQEALEESARISADLNKERAQYEDLANFASDVYFQIQELVQLNRMYRFGIREFESVFAFSLESHNDLSKSKLLQIVYNYVSWSLFPEEKIIFKMFFQKRCPGEASSLRSDESLSLRSFFKEVWSSSTSPCKLVMIITSPGSDPTAEIKEVAADLKIKEMLFLSMGADVVNETEVCIQSHKSSLCLTNLHLVVSWLPRLAKLLQDSQDSGKGQTVVMVSECHDDFPPALLEMCVKFAYESAPGLMAHINRLAFDGSIKSTPELNRLAHLHAVCCERRYFVPQGWTKGYDFGFTDFRSAIYIIQEIRKTREKRVHPDFIRGLLGTVIYGGKVDTKVDFNILQSIIRQWFSSLDDNLEKHQQADNEITLLGLAPNVIKWRETASEERTMKGLRILEKATNISQVREEMRKLRQLWDQLRTAKIVDQKPLKSNATSSAISDFVASECLLVQTMVKVIDNELKLNAGEAHESLISNETPDSWLNFYPSGPEAADLFIRAVDVIAKELNRLISSMSTTFCLSHFLSPASLLNSLRQQASRELKVSVDWIKLYCSWGRPSQRATSSVSYTLNGLLIEGAVFEDGLRECRPDSNLQSHLPSLTVSFVSKDSTAPYESEIVSLPVYGSSCRETVISWFEVPCKPGSTDHWIKCASCIVISSPQ